MSLRDIFVRFGVDIDQSPLIEAQSNVARLVVKFNQLQRIAGFALAALSVRALTDSADAWSQIENRIRNVTTTTDEFTTAQRGVVKIARDTYTPVEDVTELFQRYSLVTKRLGLEQEEVIDFTHRLNQATILSGATASESRGALIQLAQGIGTNFKASGQEIRSIQEQAPELAKIIARAAGGTEDQLMSLAKSGKITSELVVKAIRDAGPELDRAFAKRTPTFENIKTRFATEWLMLIKQMMPFFTMLIKHLGDLVQWTQEWIEKGEAMNTFIALAIIVVGALTVAFGALAVNLLLTLAPFIALYLVLQDFVTFMRGGDSIIGRFFEKIFGEGGAEKARQAIGEVWESVKDFFSWLGDPARQSATWKNFYDSAVEWVGKAVEYVQAKIEHLGYALRDTLRLALGDKVADFLGIAKLGAVDKPDEGHNAENLSPVLADSRYEQGSPAFKAEARIDNMKSFDLPEMIKSWSSRANDTVNGWLGSSDTTTNMRNHGGMFREPEVSVNNRPWGVPGSAGSVPWGGAAPTINNNIVVQGSATPEVSRDIANRAGDAVARAAIADRGRDAIGASFGVAQ